MPCGPILSYKAFYELQAWYCAAKDFSNWACYVSGPPRDGEEQKQWVLCGSVCLLDISLPSRRFEIGAIWFHPSVHGTFVMLEVAYALLRFSFERLQAGRVQWKTHHRNIASQKAAVKLGFDFEGLHRKHLIHVDGTWRNSYYYSMTDDDWLGREETTDGRQNLDVVAAAKAMEQEGVASQGRQNRLEELIVQRKREGRPLRDSIVRAGSLE